jgi:uncharacterized protein YidB (DUF937 family)
MNRGFPSMTALLGLLAIAGYQNRDKLAELLGGTQNPGGSGRPGGEPADRGGLAGGSVAGHTGTNRPAGLDGLLGGLGGAGLGGLLGGGLNELLDSFRQSGQGDVAESWVGTGPNKPVAPRDLERAIGPDTLETLSQQTGLSREEILDRLSKNLPDAVDRYTPDGQLPPRGFDPAI